MLQGGPAVGEGRKHWALVGWACYPTRPPKRAKLPLKISEQENVSLDMKINNFLGLQWFKVQS